MSSPLYGVSGGGLSVIGEYDPKITEEIDRKIRNLPVVVQRCRQKADELVKATGSANFEVVLSRGEDQQRPRAYVAPANSNGIHEELSEAVLLKAALGMAGK